MASLILLLVAALFSVSNAFILPPNLGSGRLSSKVNVEQTPSSEETVVLDETTKAKIETLVKQVKQLEAFATSTAHLAKSLNIDLNDLLANGGKPAINGIPVDLLSQVQETAEEAGKPAPPPAAAAAVVPPPAAPSKDTGSKKLYELPSKFRAEEMSEWEKELEGKGNSWFKDVVCVASEAHFDAVLAAAAREEEGGGGAGAAGAADAAAEEARSPHRLVVAMVYGDHCRACLALKPQFGRLLGQHPEVLGLLVNSGETPDLSKRLGIRGIPTFIVFKNGERRDHFTAKNRDAMEEHIGDWL